MVFKIISGNHLVYRPTDRQTVRKTIYPLFFEGGHKNRDVSIGHSPTFPSLPQNVKTIPYTLLELFFRNNIFISIFNFIRSYNSAITEWICKRNSQVHNYTRWPTFLYSFRTLLHTFLKLCDKRTDKGKKSKFLPPSTLLRVWVIKAIGSNYTKWFRYNNIHNQTIHHNF